MCFRAKFAFEIAEILLRTSQKRITHTSELIEMKWCFLRARVVWIGYRVGASMKSSPKIMVFCMLIDRIEACENYTYFVQ